MAILQNMLSWRVSYVSGESTKPQLSLFFFSADSAEREDGKYPTLFECAKFADQHRFAAVWTPERHFLQYLAARSQNVHFADKLSPS